MSNLRARRPQHAGADRRIALTVPVSVRSSPRIWTALLSAFAMVSCRPLVADLIWRLAVVLGLRFVAHAKAFV